MTSGSFLDWDNDCWFISDPVQSIDSLWNVEDELEMISEKKMRKKRDKSNRRGDGRRRRKRRAVCDALLVASVGVADGGHSATPASTSWPAVAIDVRARDDRPTPYKLRFKKKLGKKTRLNGIGSPRSNDVSEYSRATFLRAENDWQ